MKTTPNFVRPSGVVSCLLPDGKTVELPIVVGIFKHLTESELEERLSDPLVARKYTCEALRVAPWPVLRLFPRSWLLACMARATLTEGRRRALEFMLGS